MPIGIIAEYNPLHNGHILHLNKAIEKKKDIVIAVVSSSMTMRGDLSIFDKFTKTKQALEAGIDIVVELPLAYSMQRADIFARNSVDILNLLGVEEILIGSEENNIELYKSKYLEDTTKDKSISMKKSNTSILDLNSNDTLGFFYYKRIQDMHYPILLTTIKREACDYKDNELHHKSIASATAIRCNLDKIMEYTPQFVYRDKNSILDENKIFPFLKYKILSSSPSELERYFFVDEGIEYKLHDISKFDTLDSFITYLSGKKYTKTRMKRMLYYILYSVTKEEMNEQSEEISSVRILGYSTKGKEYLKKIKHNVTIYTNIKEGLETYLDIELRVSKVLDTIFQTKLLIREQKGPQTLEKEKV